MAQDLKSLGMAQEETNGCETVEVVLACDKWTLSVGLSFNRRFIVL